MGIITADQLQTALEKSKSYADATASASGLAAEAVEEVPDAEDAEKGVLYLVPADLSSTEDSLLGYAVNLLGKAWGSLLQDSFGVSLPPQDTYYSPYLLLDGAVVPLGLEQDLAGALFYLLLAVLLVEEDDYSDLNARISELEERVSALEGSDTEADSAEE